MEILPSVGKRVYNRSRFEPIAFAIGCLPVSRPAASQTERTFKLNRAPIRYRSHANIRFAESYGTQIDLSWPQKDGENIREAGTGQ